MVTESVVERAYAAAHPIASGALAADLAADPADLLELAAALGIEFRHVVTELRRAPDEPAARVLAALASLAPTPRARPPHGGDAPPFVWVRLVTTGRRPQLRARAGWLVPAGLRLIAEEARAAGPDTEVQIIVPLDSGDGAAARVRALCATVAPDVALTIEVQGETPASRHTPARGTGWRPTARASRDGRAAVHDVRAGTWIVFGSLRATS